MAVVRRVPYAVALAAIVVISACSGSTSAPRLLKLARGQENGNVATAVHAPTGSVVSFEVDLHLCSTEPVTIDSISLLQPTAGVRVEHWGIDNRGSVLTPHTIRGPLRRLGPYTSHTVTLRCGSANDTYALGAHVGVELVRMRSGAARIDGFALHYKNNKQAEDLALREVVRLCARPTPGCGRTS